MRVLCVAFPHITASHSDSREPVRQCGGATSEKGGNLCGVECDGATYHSARSVRERDRLRQEVLERLGWRIFRIWSTDWFRNPALQTKNLLEYLNKLSAMECASLARPPTMQ